MNEPWTRIVPALLVGLGVLAELNLLRMLVTECREDRRADRRERRRSPGHRAGRAGPSTRRAGMAFAAAAIAATPVVSFAQDTPLPAPTQPAPSASAAAEPAAGSAVSVQLNLDFTNAYFYRGIVQADSGFIAQPAARVTFNFLQQDDLRIDGFLGTWNSFHGQKTAAQTQGDFTEYWYESDLSAGLTLTKGKFSLTTSYTFLTSPSDAYQTVQELGFTLAFDDSDVLGKFALKPYATLAIETGADASDGADSDTGAYLELGIGPGFTFDAGKTPISISFPVSVGLSLSDYYQDAAGSDETFGFVQVGVKASLPLPFGTRFGAWTLNAGVAGLFLGDHTKEYNGGDASQFIATVGVQVTF